MHHDLSTLVIKNMLQKKTIKYISQNIFPDPESAEEDGMLACGGDLSPSTLLEAYASGIFPWYDDNTPIIWWSPNPRLVLFPEKFRTTKSLLQSVRNKTFEIKFDSNFPAVIDNCSKIRRKGQKGTWITQKMKNAYIELHHIGIAHSVETYLNGKLAGGLYGISLGTAFFGESMFHLERDASKVAFYQLIERIKSWDFDFVDAQVPTNHLKSLGAEEISRKKFLQLLNESLKTETYIGNWGEYE